MDTQKTIKDEEELPIQTDGQTWIVQVVSATGSLALLLPVFEPIYRRVLIEAALL